VRRAAFSAGLLLLAILIQLTVLDNVRLPGGAGPDLVLVVVVALGLVIGGASLPVLLIVWGLRTARLWARLRRGEERPKRNYRVVPALARVLGLLATYHREDLARALERAARYRAFSWSAVERILAAQARPRSGWESLQAEAQDQLDEILRQSPVSTRSTAEYQALLEETVTHDESDEDDDPTA